MIKKDFEAKLYRRIAQVSIGASTIRKQGGSGLIDTMRSYFENEINLKQFFSALKSQKKYQEFLDYHTQMIVNAFPKGAKSWGAARKGLNLFLRDLVYNGYFSAKYKIPNNYKELNEHLRYMEVPLDKDVVTGIKRDSSEDLPKWVGIKNLTPELSEEFQDHAHIIASNLKTARVNLDLIYWRSSE